MWVRLPLRALLGIEGFFRRLSSNWKPSLVLKLKIFSEKSSSERFTTPNINRTIKQLNL